jgi:hypothetical protein
MIDEVVAKGIPKKMIFPNVRSRNPISESKSDF